MTPLHLALSIANAMLASVAIAGLVARRRVGACTAFPAYLAVVVLGRLALWTWPAQLYGWRYWLATDLLQAVLGFAIALEFTHRAFVALPAARARALRVQIVIAAAAGLAFVWTPIDWNGSLGELATVLVGRLAYARAWLFAGGLAVAYYHRVPLDRIHRDIAGGFVVWSLLMACNAQLEPLDGYLQVTRQTVASLVYPGVLLAWAAAAWARDEETAFPRELLLQLRPWRA